MIGYAGLTMTVIRSGRGRVPPMFWRVTATIIVIHVALVWAVRYEWHWAEATRNGYTGALVFHSALALIIASVFLRDRAATTLIRLAFVVVSLGALGAVFRYDEVAGYRVPVIVLALAGVVGLVRIRTAPS